MPKQKVVLGLLGTTLDTGPRSSKRWEKWRPTVTLFQNDDLLFDRFEMLHSAKHAALAEQVKADIAAVSPETRVESALIEFSDAWDFEEVYGKLFDFASGYSFQPEHFDYYLHITTGTHVAQICMFLLTESRRIPACLIQTAPPAKPSRTSAGEYRVIDLDLSKYDSLAKRFSLQKRDDISLLKSGIETKNEVFNELIDQLEYIAAQSREPILLTGPTGVGKSQLAKRIYELKRRHHKLTGDFVEVNCSTVRGDTALATLFGHSKGAFTGAERARSGLLLSADRGILFLDEIGELGPDEQAMLLRAIEEKSFFPVGADKEVSSDFQLIAGTNKDLNESVRRGTFRADLLARINLWTYALPVLSERREDIAPNLEFELERCSHVLNRRVSMNREAKSGYLAFALSRDAVWSGNFRDLGASVMRMATLAPGGRITPSVVQTEIERLKRLWAEQAGEGKDAAGLVQTVLSREALAQLDLFDKVQLEAVLKVCRSSRTLSEAGRTLFSASRKDKATTNDADRLRKYLLRFGLNWHQAAERSAV